MTSLQIRDDAPHGPFPDEDHQVSFQRQHADGLKQTLCGRRQRIFFKGEVVEYADMLSRSQMEVCNGF